MKRAIIAAFLLGGCAIPGFQIPTGEPLYEVEKACAEGTQLYAKVFSEGESQILVGIGVKGQPIRMWVRVLNGHPVEAWLDGHKTEVKKLLTDYPDACDYLERGRTA